MLLDRNREFAESSLEGGGFEPSVPGREIKPWWETGLAISKGSGSVGEPKVRIHLPPAAVRAKPATSRGIPGAA